MPAKKPARRRRSPAPSSVEVRARRSLAQLGKALDKVRSLPPAPQVLAAEVEPEPDGIKISDLINEAAACSEDRKLLVDRLYLRRDELAAALNNVLERLAELTGSWDPPRSNQVGAGVAGSSRGMAQARG